MTIQSMVGSLINICHALSKLSFFFGWEKSKMSVDPIPEPGWYENIGLGRVGRLCKVLAQGPISIAREKIDG